MKKVLIIHALVCLLSILVGCSASEPAGPAEQIGKGIDMITKGLQDIDQDQEARARAERAQHEKEREHERLNEDSYYDSSADSTNAQQTDSDWNSKRRY